MKITESISIVGGGKWSGGFSHPLDCSIYLIRTGDGLLMIDSGCGIDISKIEKNMSDDGYEMKDIRLLALTHYHADHACGAQFIHQRSGCRVIIGEPEAECVRTGDEIASSLAVSKGSVYPMDYIYQACPCVEGIQDGDIISLGEISLKAFLISGHSRADLNLYGTVGGKKCLFCGDTIFAGGEVLLQSLYDVSILPYREGMNRLAGCDVDSLFPGHGQFVLEDAGWHIARCAEGFNSGLVPKQFHFFS